MRLGRLGVAQPASPQPLNLQQGGTDGSSSSSLLRGTAAAGGSAPQMGGLGSQPGRGAHMQAISGVAAGLGSAPATDLSRSHGRSVQETSWRLQALTEDNSRAIAQGVRESTASAAAMGASASTAHSTRAPGADIGSGQANRLMPQDELSLQVLEQMSQRVNFSRDGSPRRVVRYSQHATGHSTDGDIAPAGGRPGAAAEHQLLLRQQQQQQQQQQALSSGQTLTQSWARARHSQKGTHGASNSGNFPPGTWTLGQRQLQEA
ncbi:hypothetical protein HYH02_015405 [Chlamydomonas schloesseri]|uniref:Uncharacterized protein n=1 Tax=Chlamydomonas schloesseri TaxID=2026947 RepID=A0A835VRD6_9CHLO|nr:hypothetical protein HYH02_015405 [Chlamydomonas schloesseri]|eukprot:KAG2422666.1 hypothetical protein HYH02_015405 [Chlamydomonas schloesseri]